MDGLLDAAQRAVKAAMDAGAEFADAYCSRVREISVGVENTSLRECEVVRDYGIGVRAFCHGGMGLASAQSLEYDDAVECGQRAAEMARAADADPDFVSLPQPAEPPQVTQLYDDTLAGLAVTEVVAWCRQAIEESRAVEPDVHLEGGADLAISGSALASSSGIALQRRGTSASISFQALVVRDGDVGMYFEYDAARRLADFVPAGVAAKATREARRYLGGKNVATRRLPIVLGPLAASGLLFSVVGTANAEHVQRNRSFLGGKEQQRIASELLTITEAPLVPGGLSSIAYDGEGVPKVRRELIENGVLTTYLHNSYTANKAGVANTAHASRGGYSGSVGISTANLQVAPGSRTEAELIAEIDDGLYVAYGGIQPEAASGDISATIDFGFRIENGALTHPVATTMIGSDAFEMLGNIDAVSSDYREEPGIIVPSLRIADIQVASGQ
jgi:PmbA protein